MAKTLLLRPFSWIKELFVNFIIPYILYALHLIKKAFGWANDSEATNHNVKRSDLTITDEKEIALRTALDRAHILRSAIFNTASSISGVSFSAWREKWCDKGQAYAMAYLLLLRTAPDNATLYEAMRRYPLWGVYDGVYDGQESIGEQMVDFGAVAMRHFESSADKPPFSAIVTTERHHILASIYCDRGTKNLTIVFAQDFGKRHYGSSAIWLESLQKTLAPLCESHGYTLTPDVRFGAESHRNDNRCGLHAAQYFAAICKHHENRGRAADFLVPAVDNIKVADKEEYDRLVDKRKILYNEGFTIQGTARIQQAIGEAVACAIEMELSLSQQNTEGFSDECKACLVDLHAIYAELKNASGSDIQRLRARSNEIGRDARSKYLDGEGDLKNSRDRPEFDYISSINGNLLHNLLRLREDRQGLLSELPEEFIQYIGYEKNPELARALGIAPAIATDTGHDVAITPSATISQSQSESEHTPKESRTTRL